MCFYDNLTEYDTKLMQITRSFSLIASFCNELLSRRIKMALINSNKIIPIAKK